MKVNVEQQTYKRDKRNLILDISAKLFSEYGFHEVNMEMIAHAAGIAKGTIYNYFKSKEDVYFTINETRLEKLISELEKKFEKEASIIENLRGFVIHVFMFLLKYKDFFLIFQRTRLKKQKLKSKNLEDLIQKLKDLLANILKEGIEKKEFKVLDICFTADIILGMIYSGVLRNLDRDLHDERLQREREELFGLVLDTIRTKEKTSLNNITILITRTKEQSENEIEKLKRLGAKVIQIPTIKIIPPSSWKACDDAIKEFDSFNYIVFTSANSVEWFIKRLELFEKADSLKDKKIIAIGSKTEKKLLESDLHVHYRPEKFNSEKLVEELIHFIQKDEKVLLPQSEIGNDLIEKSLTKHEIHVCRVPVYTVDIPTFEDVEEQIRELNQSEVDIYVFTSPSTFDNFCRLIRIDSPQKYFVDKVIAVIGPTTRKHIESFGIEVRIEPEVSTFEMLIEEIINFVDRYGNKK